MAKKRANGEGNIRKRKDGRWEGRYTAGVDPETGKPIAKSVLARTQRECKEKLQKAMEELEKIDVTKRRDYTVGEWAQLRYENYAKPSVRASTAAYYKNYIDQHIKPRIGDIKLTALTTLQIQKFYNETKAHGRVQRYENMDDLSLSNKTIRGLHTMLRQCLEQAVTERLIPYNPANGCRLPKKEKKKMQIIPPEKIRDYLKAAEEWGVLPMFYLELSTGLRRGELVALLWSDLNLQTKTLTVSKSVSRGKGELVVTEPKTENSVREIYLSDEAIRLLVENRKNHPFSPYLFPSPKTGGMYGPDCVGRIHKKLLEKAGIEEHVRFHDLRHTFSTLAIQSGIDPKTVAEILGHASAEFSLDVYTRHNRHEKRSRAENQRLHGECRITEKMNRKAHAACRNCSGRRRILSSGDFRSEFPFGSRLGQTEKSQNSPSKKVRNMQKNPAEIKRFQPDLVGVSGFEPEASWSRTKRDTKLRHTPSARLL